jgi:hypothetical protein
MKILMINGSPEPTMTTQDAARRAAIAILSGKTVEYKELSTVSKVSKKLGIQTEAGFFEKVPIEMPPQFWAFKTPAGDIVPVMKSMKRGKLHILIAGAWHRASEIRMSVS